MADTKYTAYASKAEFLRDLIDYIKYGRVPDMEMIQKLNNTDTDNWTADSTATIDE